MPSPTPAGQTPYTNNDDGTLRVDWAFRLGNTWSSEELAVLVDGGPVNLEAGGWHVRAQARRYSDAEAVLAEWTTENDRIRLGTATVTVDDAGTQLTTSTVQAHHGPDSRHWSPFEQAVVELEVYRRPQPDVDPSADDAESYTIAAGTVSGSQDVTR